MKERKIALESLPPASQEAIQLAGENLVVVVLDLDEVIYNAARKHHRLLNAAYTMAGCNNNLPSYEEFCALGGSDNAYTHIPSYPRLNEVMKSDPRFNRNIPLLDEEVPSILSEILRIEGVTPIMYLTTRPARLASLSKEELLKSGCPDLPVLARPDTVPFERTSSWKLERLREIVTFTSGHVVMIDDSFSLAKAIEETDNPKIHSFLFAGPVTPKDGNAKVTWQTLPQKLEELRDQIRETSFKS